MNFESGDLAICDACGTQYDVPLSSPPKECRICLVSDVKEPSYNCTISTIPTTPPLKNLPHTHPKIQSTNPPRTPANTSPPTAKSGPP